MTVNHDVAGSSPAGGARKKTVTFVTVFFQRCVPQAERDVSFESEVRFACEVCLRHVIQNTSHHCDHIKRPSVQIVSAKGKGQSWWSNEVSDPLCDYWTATPSIWYKRSFLCFLGWRKKHFYNYIAFLFLLSWMDILAWWHTVLLLEGSVEIWNVVEPAFKSNVYNFIRCFQ